MAISRFMAQTVVPYYGLKISFTGKERVEKNHVDGQVRYLGYAIHGEEAISFAALDALSESLAVLGKVETNEVKDIEG
jgi:hypothetical protein